MQPREKLRAFVNHVRTLTQKDENGDDGFDREYKSIKDLQLTIKDDPKYPVEDGRLPCNKKKNRYKDILPFDFCRVALTPTHDEGSDYINASFLQDVNGENGYIAAMGPLTATLNDYWRMLWEYGIKTVVMVCKEVELGKKKCAKYWPDDLDSSVSFAGVTVRVMDESQRSGEIDVRVLEAEFKGERRTIMQYHFQSWPDHGVPESAQPIVDLIQIFREHQPTNNPPIVVHCSAGCGRTGTVCAVDYAWQLLESQIESDVSVLEIVSMFRHQRLSMVQTKDQYVLIYKAVLKLVKSYLASRSSSAVNPQARAAPPPVPEPTEEELYQNVDVLGGMAYGAQATGLVPKAQAAPPIPPTKRLGSTSSDPADPVTSIDDITLTAEQEEEMRQLQMRMTVSSQRKPSFLNSAEDEELEELEEDMPPPVPMRTEGASQLLEFAQSLEATSNEMYAEVPRTPSRPPSRSDLHRDDSSGPPPVLPTRTTDSYILTEEQRQLNEPPRVPTSPRPSQSDIQPPAHLTAAGRPLSTGVPMEFSSLQSDTGRAVTPTTPGAGNSNTLPVPGKHAESPNAHSNSSSSVVSNTKRVFRNLVPGTRRNQRTTGGAPVISSPVGMDSNEQKVPPQPTHTSSAVIVPVFSDDMGFKNRVPRPKGPRSMPANWRSFG